MPAQSGNCGFEVIWQGNTWGTTDLIDGEWHHVAAVLEDDGTPDVSEVKLYVDGRLDPIAAGGRPRAIDTSSGGEFRIAYDLNNTARSYQGLMDDVRIYDRALSADDIQALIQNPGGTATQAMRPDPADGALHEDTWAILKWLPGDFALSNDVYISNNFDDVNDGLESTFQGNVDMASFTLGSPGFAFPDGLVPGTTYYWRIDEVNDAEPNSPWTGSLWSFTTADFLIIDDFEDYDVGENQIWYAWHDGLGFGTPGTETYYAGNGTGSAVGWDDTPSYTEETIVHGGRQSMPFTTG